MSEQIKYEAVFGDQSLFDGAPDDAEMAYETANHVRGYYKKCNSLKFFSNSKWVRVLNEKAMIIHAMRRIIRTPTWTKEDQKAGKLPEVGAFYDAEGCRVKHLGVGAAGYEDIFHFEYPSGACGCSNKIFIKPIETPREKYDRERDECINKLISELPRHPISQKHILNSLYEEIRPFTGDDHDQQ